MKAWSILPMLLLLSGPALAQSPEWPELLCPIVSFERQGSTYDALLACGSLDGIKPGSRTGAPIQRHVPEQNSGARVIGNVGVSLSEVQYLSSRVRLELPADEVLSPGDLVPLEIADAPAPTQTLDELSRLGIVFTSQAGVPWVLYRDYLSQPQHDFEAERLPLMLTEVHEMALYADEVYNDKPLPEGYFAGKTLRQAMLASEVSDLGDFLKFVQGFPGKYLGQHWKFSEVYATWLINGAPGPDDDSIEVIPDELRPDLPEPADTLGQKPGVQAGIAQS